MKIKYDKVWLIGVTIIFVILGSFVVYLSLNRVVGLNSCSHNSQDYISGEVVLGYKDGFDCICDGGQITCTSTAENIVKPTLDKFKRENLKVTPKYLVSGTKDNVSSLPLKTRFTSVSSGKTLNITIEQEQKCSEDLRAPIQLGMFYKDKNRLYLTNVVNKAPNLYFVDCIVSVNYSLSNWKFSGDDLEIIYMNEAGEEYKAPICSYDKNSYLEGDTYLSTDNCNICKCIGGISKCSNDRVCDSK